MAMSLPCTHLDYPIANNALLSTMPDTARSAHLAQSSPGLSDELARSLDRGDALEPDLPPEVEILTRAPPLDIITAFTD